MCAQVPILALFQEGTGGVNRGLKALLPNRRDITRKLEAETEARSPVFNGYDNPAIGFAGRSKRGTKARKRKSAAGRAIVTKSRLTELIRLRPQAVARRRGELWSERLLIPQKFGLL